jgi:hypothetical protein
LDEKEYQIWIEITEKSASISMSKHKSASNTITIYLSTETCIL